MVRMVRAPRWLVLTVALASLGGCAAFYVDGHAPEVPVAQYKKPASPPQVQLVWEFQTKGVSNARATDWLKTRVQEQFGSSGLFAKVSDAPVPGGALLTATVNNIPLKTLVARLVDDPDFRRAMAR